MNKFIDLSQNIVNEMPVHPDDKNVQLYQNKHLEKDGYNNFRLEIGMHSGTHIDAPMHLTEQNIFINEIALEKFAGKGILLDVRGQKIIKYNKEYINLINKNDIVLIFTGHGDKFEKEEYYSKHPVISDELANFLIKKQIKIIAMDLPSPDNHPFNIHKKFLKNNILIIENLCNLSELLKINDFNIYAFPLKIRAEASMVRVVAEITGYEHNDFYRYDEG